MHERNDGFNNRIVDLENVFVMQLNFCNFSTCNNIVNRLFIVFRINISEEKSFSTNEKAYLKHKMIIFGLRSENRLRK